MLIKILTIALLGQLAYVNIAQAISYRLPQEVKPIRYHIELRPDFQNDIFTGDVQIEVEAVKNSNSITLNQVGLIMPSKNNVEVVEIESNTRIPVLSVGPGESPDQQFFVISLANSLSVGKQYLVKIPNFTGIFKTTPNNGFYYAKYYDDSGKLRVLATTQFEAVNARRAFPCFDEPALKARFNLVIKRPSNNYISVANTPLDENLSSGLTDVFKETDLMSTYLVCFIVSEMELSETMERQRVLAPSFELAENKHKYSLNGSVYILQEMENFIETPYTFEKLDHASIPHNYYEAGAMENWGLITYRDDILLVSPNSPPAYKKQALTVVAHEVAHQWFGNLVSPEWWEYIWLNEGFANYFEHYLAHQVERSFDIWRQFTVVSGGNALEVDGYPFSTRPMNTPVEKPDDIYGLFDSIAYQKSGAVIRMLEHAISTPVFRQGLIYYIQDRQFQGATPTQLYSSIQRAVDEYSLETLPQSSTVADFMTTWDSVSGFPIVTVTRSYGNATDNIQLNQRVYNNYNNQGENGKWSIPINYATNSSPSFDNTLPQVWLQNSQDSITVSNLKDIDWIIVNKQRAGHYRVNYDERNWDLISTALKNDFSQINALNRAQLIDDCRHFVRSGDLPQRVCNKLEEYSVNENDSLVWFVLFSRFAFLDNVLYYTQNHEQLKQRILHLLEKSYERLTFEEKPNEQPKEKEFRANVLFWMCKMGHKECRTKSQSKFIAWQNGQTDIPADLQQSIFCGAMRSGNKNQFEYLFNLFTKTKDYQFQTRLASGLSCMEKVKSLRRILKYALNQKSPALLKHVIKSMYPSSKVGLETVVNFVSNNFAQIHKMYRKQTTQIIEELARNLYSPTHLMKLKQLEVRTRTSDVLDNALTMVSENVKWLEKNKNNLL